MLSYYLMGAGFSRFPQEYAVARLLEHNRREVQQIQASLH